MDAEERKTWPVQQVSKDIQCKDCKYRQKPVKVAGQTIERYTSANCDIYGNNKPLDVLLKGAECEAYAQEANND